MARAFNWRTWIIRGSTVSVTQSHYLTIIWISCSTHFFYSQSSSWSWNGICITKGSSSTRTYRVVLEFCMRPHRVMKYSVYERLKCDGKIVNPVWAARGILDLWYDMHIRIRTVQQKDRGRHDRQLKLAHLPGNSKQFKVGTHELMTSDRKNSWNVFVWHAWWAINRLYYW